MPPRNGATVSRPRPERITIKPLDRGLSPGELTTLYGGLTSFEVLQRILAEVERQDELCDHPYEAHRDSVRLGLATIGDELDEALEAWQRDKKLDGDRWAAVRDEVTQAAAVAVRLLRVLDQEGR